MSATMAPGMHLPTLEGVAGRLSQVSERDAEPTFNRIAYPPALDTSRLLLPPALLSLYGHPAFDALTGPQRWRLSLLETVNFFSMNIHGEQALVGELAQRLYRGQGVSGSPEVSRYLQHFIHEENAHTYMLAEFCTRYHGQVLPDQSLRFELPALSRAGTDLLFFARVYVLETLLAFVNRAVMRDATTEPTARAVHRAHHVDETRHIAFDRALLARLGPQLQAPALAAERAEIAALIVRYAEHSFSRLAEPRLYRDLGLPDPLRLAHEAVATPHRRALRQRWWQQPEAFLRKVGVLPPAPAVASP